MNRALPILLAALVGLAACNNDSDRAAGDADAPSSTREETREAIDAIGEAARQTGEAARSAAEDAAEALGPTLDRAREAGRNALEATREGVNDATRSTACRTAQAAEDAEGIAANC